MVVVVVTSDPGDWFGEVLGALRDQTYTSLSTLVVDTGTHDVTDTVHGVLPSALSHRDSNLRGFAAAANSVLELVDGAAFYLFMHDDVALEPQSIEVLVAESLRSNASILGPKLVDWSKPGHIRSVGMAVDKMGVQAPYAEPGELDQAQHDRVRDAFAVQGGATLVRADLFNELGGYDTGIDFLGEDVDLCWRAHVVGARVLVAPEAVGRHLEALGARRPEIRRRQRLSRHRLRTICKCYGWLDLLRVLPQALAWSLGEILLSICTGRFQQARDIAGAWTWNAARTSSIMAGRRRLKKLRRVRDSDIRRLQVRGSARFTAYIRGQIGAGSRLQDLATRGREVAGTLSDGPRRMAVGVWLGLIVFLFFGARHLITRGVVDFGQFTALPSRGVLLASFGSGWSDVELGSSGFAPAGVGLLGLASTLFLGATGFMQTVLIVGLIPLGWFGAWRLGGPLGSRRGRLVAAVVYAAVPLPYDAIALGRWDALLLYGSMPFIVLRLARLIGVAPYGNRHGVAGPGVPDRSVAHQVISLAMLLAVVAAFEPLVLLLVPALAAVLAVASVVTGTLWLPMRAVLMSAISSAMAVALHGLWWLRFVDEPRAGWNALIGVQRGGPTDLVDLFGFSVGPWSSSRLLLAIPVVAALALILGREWRAAWAPRAWALAVASIGIAWVSTNDFLPVELPDAHVLLVPAGVGFAWAAGIGFAAFELDVPRFGQRPRRIAIAVGVVGLFASVGPAFAAAGSGTFGAPGTDLSGAIRFVTANPEAGNFRVLWVGDAELLPSPGRELSDTTSVSLSVDGLPDVRSNWLPPATDATDELMAILAAGFGGETARFGRLLAPFAVRYVIIPQSNAPTFAEGEVTEADPALIATLSSQLDMRRIATDPSVIVFENVDWRPIRSMTVVDNPVLDIVDRPTLAVTPPGEWLAALTGRESSTQYLGPLPVATVTAAWGDGDDWSLVVNGQAVGDSGQAGWEPSWNVTTAGDATLEHNKPGGFGWLLIVQWLGWVVVARIAFAEGRRSVEREPDVESSMLDVTEEDLVSAFGEGVLR